MFLEPGQMIDRYHVDCYINEGGMQQVYKATDTVFKRHVALKTPKNDDGSRRFDRSAHLSARINHDNIARTLDYVELNNERFLIEEHIEGLDLGQILKLVPKIDPYISARVLHGLARGMAAVHEVGVVHRDLKPSNIMIVGGMQFKEIKITDFGVAKMAEAEIDTGLTDTNLLSLTGSKTLIGHLPYLAPEILRKKRTVDVRCDVWAVGALAFHLLTGAPPFGSELADAVVQILNGPIPSLPDDLDCHPQFRDLGREIYGIICACLQKDPDARLTSLQLLKLSERLCYPIVEREVGTVEGYPGGTFGFARSENGKVFFHVDSVVGSSHPRIGSKIWFSRHRGSPYDRAHPIVPVQEEVS